MFFVSTVFWPWHGSVTGVFLWGHYEVAFINFWSPQWWKSWWLLYFCLFKRVWNIKTKFLNSVSPCSAFIKVWYPQHLSIYCTVLLQGVTSGCCAPLKKRSRFAITELPQRNIVDGHHFMFTVVFWHHQVRGVGGVHGVVVIRYNQAECLMKCGAVAEEKVKQTNHAEWEL